MKKFSFFIDIISSSLNVKECFLYIPELHANSIKIVVVEANQFNEYDTLTCYGSTKSVTATTRSALLKATKGYCWSLSSRTLGFKNLDQYNPQGKSSTRKRLEH